MLRENFYVRPNRELKVPITPNIVLARDKSLYRTKQDSAKISSFGWNLDFLWIFKVGNKRPHLKHYRVKNYQIGSGSTTIRDVIPGFLLWERWSTTFSTKMPDARVVFGCNNTRNRKEGIGLHPIPSYGAENPQKRKRRKKVGWLLEAHGFESRMLCDKLRAFGKVLKNDVAH